MDDANKDTTKTAGDKELVKPTAAPEVKKPTAAEAEADAQLEANRKEPVRVVNPRAPEEVAKQHEAVDAEREARNEANREGHEKNMEAIEAAAHEAQARTAHADDHRAKHVPTGKENNRNTPRVLADGTKVWDQ